MASSISLQAHPNFYDILPLENILLSPVASSCSSNIFTLTGFRKIAELTSFVVYYVFALFLQKILSFVAVRYLTKQHTLPVYVLSL